MVFAISQCDERLLNIRNDGDYQISNKKTGKQNMFSGSLFTNTDERYCHTLRILGI